ncbi:MAG: hypothetical protein JXA93_24180 [Anaerolineae bacterium]|nr:hypothetical protein [Anaerolineae bacterium]
MFEVIGYCGYNCHLCAARSDDPAVRQCDSMPNLVRFLVAAGKLPNWLVSAPPSPSPRTGTEGER